MREPPLVPAKKSPAAMDIADLARLLRASGAKHADIDAGAPTNADGTVNLVHYGAWLVRQATAMEGRRGD